MAGRDRALREGGVQAAVERLQGNVVMGVEGGVGPIQVRVHAPLQRVLIRAERRADGGGGVRAGGGDGRAQEGLVQAAVGAGRGAGGDERVGVGGRVRLAVDARVAVAHLLVLEVVLEVLRLQRLAQRQLLGVPHTQLLAQLPHGGEGLDGEVDLGVEVAQVGQLHAHRLVHGREVQARVGLHAALVQRGARARQPAVALGPPQRVVGPVHGHL